VDATYDTTPKKMTWTTTDSGLTGSATTAHFSGPAELGKSAPPVVAISGNFVSPINREAILTDAQAFELQGSRWYFNVQTEANRGGEIRGQLMKK
jgi:CHRD domain